MRALFMGLAALAVLALLVNYEEQSVVTQFGFSSIPAIVAVDHVFAPTAPNSSGVIVTANYSYMDHVSVAAMANVAPEVAAVNSTRPELGNVDEYASFNHRDGVGSGLTVITRHAGANAATIMTTHGPWTARQNI